MGSGLFVQRGADAKVDNTDLWELWLEKESLSLSEQLRSGPYHEGC